MKMDFYTAVKERRTYYDIGKEKLVSEERIEEVIGDAVKYAPSSFNSQSSRVVVLFGEGHNQLWDITMDTLRKIVPGEAFQATEDKINSFKNGYGTVLFFEDDNVIEELQQKFALYKEKFPVWAEQSSGMLQYIVWTSLEMEGLGASLQHYNPLIDEEVKEKWGIPQNWRLIAQMPFGSRTGEAGNKQLMPIEERFRVFK